MKTNSFQQLRRYIAFYGGEAKVGTVQKSYRELRRSGLIRRRYDMKRQA